MRVDLSSSACVQQVLNKSLLLLLPISLKMVKDSTVINASVAHEHGNWEPVFQDGTPSSSGARQLAFPASSVNTGPPNPTCLDRLPQCFPRDKVAFLYLLSRKWNQGWGGGLFLTGLSILSTSLAGHPPCLSEGPWEAVNPCLIVLCDLPWFLH